MVSKISDFRLLISQGYFESVTHYIVRRILNKLFRRQDSNSIKMGVFSVVLATIFILIVFIGMAGSYLFGPVEIASQVYLIFLLGVAYIYVLCIAVEFQIVEFTSGVKDNILGALMKKTDRQSLWESMESIFSLRGQFWFGFLFSLFVHLAFIILDPNLIGRFGVGLIVTNIIIHSFHGFCVYFYFAYLEWAISNLKNYKFRLFALDPSKTEIISKLATLLQSTISLMTLMVASATLIFSSTRVLPFASVAGMVLLMWMSTISLYFVNRHIMKSIIVKAKWETMAKIQAQIRELESVDVIPKPKTLKHISQLQEYHDKILNSPNSPWDFIRFVNTLNTLVWPTFGVVATNVGDFIDFIEQVKNLFSPSG